MLKPFAALALAAALSAVLAACAASQAADEPAGPPAGSCNAAAYQNLVGRLKSEIPAKPAGAVWRVACTTCPVTMDFNPARLNIFFDEATGVIKEVKCG